MICHATSKGVSLLMVHVSAHIDHAYFDSAHFIALSLGVANNLHVAKH